tara:strand:- start:3974 stop:5296 length:1323 start_codon:yes stop_codon:yes gene_type:complete
MKLVLILFIFLCFSSCSFDNKSGIWINENQNLKKEEKFSELETLISSKESFNEIVKLDKNFNFKNLESKRNLNWSDIFYNERNNGENLSYDNKNNLLLKSKKLSRNEIKEFFLFNKGNIILSDVKGNLIVYSLNDKNVKVKFNFYKKKFKKINKNLNIIANNDNIFVSDNLGFLYSYNYEKNKIIWAKNYKIPFRSNLKITKNKLVAADQSNNLYFFDLNSGEIIKKIPTEETILKNNFINNLSANEDKIFYLNTYGSLYTLDKNTNKINWFLNLNQSEDINPSNLFISNQIVNNGKKISISSDKFTYIIDVETGRVDYKQNFSSAVKPILTKKYLFLITKNNLLISIDLEKYQIIYSQDLNEKIAKYLNVKKKSAEFKSMMMANNYLYLFLKNSYFLKLNLNGEIQKVKKLSSKLKTYPIFVDNSLMFLNKKNRLIVID